MIHINSAKDIKAETIKRGEEFKYKGTDYLFLEKVSGKNDKGRFVGIKVLNHKDKVEVIGVEISSKK